MLFDELYESIMDSFNDIIEEGSAAATGTAQESAVMTILNDMFSKDSDPRINNLKADMFNNNAESDVFVYDKDNGPGNILSVIEVKTHVKDNLFQPRINIVSGTLVFKDPTICPMLQEFLDEANQSKEMADLFSILELNRDDVNVESKTNSGQSEFVIRYLSALSGGKIPDKYLYKKENVNITQYLINHYLKNKNHPVDFIQIGNHFYRLNAEKTDGRLDFDNVELIPELMGYIAIRSSYEKRNNRFYIQLDCHIYQRIDNELTSVSLFNKSNLPNPVIHGSRKVEKRNKQLELQFKD